MATFSLPRFLEEHQARLEHARKLEATVKAVGGDPRERKPIRSAADGRTLRGIPAIGRGVAGVIGGTQPGGAD